MAERPAVTSRALGRDELARVIADPRVRRAFESLSVDVARVLPDAAQAVAAIAEAARDAADAAHGEAVAAVLRAAAALETAAGALSAALDADAAAHAAPHQIGQLREQVAALSARLDDMEQGPPR